MRSFSINELAPTRHLAIESTLLDDDSEHIDGSESQSVLDNDDVPDFALQMLYNIMNRVKSLLNFDFDRLLINRYENGTDYIGSHSDKEVYPGDPVVSICYGATRTFRIRDKITKNIVLDVPHQHGTLLVMAGNFQHEFKHEIPVQKRVYGTRISVTLRRRHGDAYDDE
jgi:alkylated DNA repair dioxygenase AlkB